MSHSRFGLSSKKGRCKFGQVGSGSVEMKEHISDDSNNSHQSGREKLRSLRARHMMKNKRMLKIRLAVLSVSLLGILVAYLFLKLWMNGHLR